MQFIFNEAFTNNAGTILHKGADGPAIHARILNDDGTPLNLTTTPSTVTLQIYSVADRSVAPVLSLSLATIVAAAGDLNLIPVAANIVLPAGYVPGTYYGFLKQVVTAGGAIHYSTNSVKIIIG